MGIQTLDEEKALSRFQGLMKSEHWLATYVKDLLSAHDLSAGIDFGTAEANTTYGKIGVKAWIYRGEQHKAKTRRKTA